MKSVFLVQHLHTLPQGEDDVKLIGVYATEAEAIEATKRMAIQPGFCDFPRIIDQDKSEDDQGFHIDEYELGKDFWTEGYMSSAESRKSDFHPLFIQEQITLHDEMN